MMVWDDYNFEDGFMADGSVVIFPTDTVYGLACRLYDEEALNKVKQIKKDFEIIHFAILMDSLVSINDVAIIDDRAKKLMIAFWPGALTLILNSTKSHYEKTGEAKIGVRIPNHNGALKLIKQNGPLVTTSVMDESNQVITNVKDIKALFQDKVDYIYDELNAFYLNTASTTIDISEDEIKYLRIGNITKTDIINALK